MSEWPFDPLRPLSYGVILCDPPWRFRTFNDQKETKSARKHYDVMSLADMKALPVSQLATDHCAMIMWAVQPMIPDALDLMSAWGLKYKTIEFFIIGTIGKPEIGARNVRNLIVAPVREHSRKPVELHANIERLFPCSRRAELFARESREGWDCWGNQATKFD